MAMTWELIYILQTDRTYGALLATEWQPDCRKEIEYKIQATEWRPVLKMTSAKYFLIEFQPIVVRDIR